jgi:uncharacterized repeat protein (TIGR01451 family)
VRGFVIAIGCAFAVAFLVATAGTASAQVICPPPPCGPAPLQPSSSEPIVCPLAGSGTAVIPCGCPVILGGTSIPVPVDGCVDLAVTNRVDRATATVGDRLVYTIDVRNNGPDPATGAAVTDSLPNGLTLVSSKGPSGDCGSGPQVTCALGALAPGEGATATVVARAVQAGDLTNTAVASSTASDMDPSNDQAAATTHVTPEAPPPSPPRVPFPPPSSRYCSPSGDVCYGRLGGRGPVRLGVTLAARYFKRYELCVTAPTGGTTCHRFRVHRTSRGTWKSTVRWSSRFPNGGPGTYTATWGTRSGPLGPAIGWCRGVCIQ